MLLKVNFDSAVNNDQVYQTLSRRKFEVYARSLGWLVTSNWNVGDCELQIAQEFQCDFRKRTHCWKVFVVSNRRC